MRYLIFFSLLFFSSFSFAQISCTVDAGGANDCGFSGGNPSKISNGSAVCAANKNYFVSAGSCPAGSANPTGSVYKCWGSCSCPPGQRVNTVINGGLTVTSCVPDEPTPQNCANGSPPPAGHTCDECPDGNAKVFDPSTGQMVCPGSGDGSSSAAASSQSCVVPGDFNGDCVPDTASSEANSSPPASAANSSPPASASASSPPSSTGGDSDGGGGGGGSGSGSGSGAQNSSSPSGSNSSWTPYAQYGNWIPVSADSNCPNKYKDASGQWWCSGSTGSNTSAKGECDPTSKDYLACITQSGVNNSSGSNSSECNPSMSNYLDCSGKLSESQGNISELADKFSESTDKEMEKFKKAVDDDLSNLQRDGLSFKDQPSILRSALVAFLPVSRSCNPPPLKIMGSTYELDCEYFELFKSAFGWFLAVLTVWNIWQLAIRPVDR